jgi:carboxylesterase type B
LVWFYAGRFTIGNTDTPFYQGQYIVDAQDIVFVSVNYRLNIFGFSGAPGEAANVGLLDQRVAIEWVRDNIAGFGGDPERISIMGHSAGGAAVGFHAYAYPKDPIVAGIISHSGTAVSFIPNTPGFSRQGFLTAAQSIGCIGSEDNVVSCMRQLDFMTLLGSIRSVRPLPSAALLQPVFHPAVDNKAVFTYQEYPMKGQAGNFAHVVSLAVSHHSSDSKPQSK